eukprot:g73943.t1
MQCDLPDVLKVLRSEPDDTKLVTQLLQHVLKTPGLYLQYFRQGATEESMQKVLEDYRQDMKSLRASQKDVGDVLEFALSDLLKTSLLVFDSRHMEARLVTGPLNAPRINHEPLSIERFEDHYHAIKVSGPYKSWVFWNNKGGVGKTTTGYHFGVEMAFRNPEKKVLLIDLDSQANLSKAALGGIQSGKKLLYQLQRDKKTVRQFITERLKNVNGAKARLNDFTVNIRELRQGKDLYNKQNPPNLYLFPGFLDLDIFASTLETHANMPILPSCPNPFYDTYSLLRKAINELGNQWIVVIDTNPSFTIMSQEFSEGGVESVLAILGCATDLKHEISQTFLDVLTAGQSTEKARLVQQGMNEQEYEALPVAKLRCVLVNKLELTFWKPGQGKWRAASKAKYASLLQIVAEAYRRSLDRFASPHGCQHGVFENNDKGLTAAKDFIGTNYLLCMPELKGTMIISQHFGMGVTAMNRNQKSYKINGTVAKIAEDGPRFGLAVQDLVEFALQSRNDDDYWVKGVAVWGNKTHYQLDWKIICPATRRDFKEKPGMDEEVIKRRGRRVFPLEKAFWNKAKFQGFAAGLSFLPEDWEYPEPFTPAAPSDDSIPLPANVEKVADGEVPSSDSDSEEEEEMPPLRRSKRQRRENVYPWFDALYAMVWHDCTDIMIQLEASVAAERNQTPATLGFNIRTLFRQELDADMTHDDS